LDISSLGLRQHNLPLNGAYRTDQISTELDLRFLVARKPAFSEVWTKKGIISPKLQLISGHTEEKSLVIYRDLALVDVSNEYEEAMKSFPVK
jgi:hypothetical protein